MMQPYDAQSEARTKAKGKLELFRYEDISLENSLWKHQRDAVIELYLSLSNGDILKSPLQERGIPSPYQGLPGWGGTMGQILGSYAKLYCATGDYRLKAKAISLFEDYDALTLEHPELLHQGTYYFDKTLGGLLDLYEFMGCTRVTDAISRLVDQSMIDLDRTIDRDGLQDARMKGQIEWYTLPENLYRAYQLLGDEKYKTYAAVWHYDYMWDKVLNHDFKIGPRHAYSHVNCLSSAARAYEVTGDEKYLDVMKIAYDEITAHHTYATGGYGPAENLFVDREGYLGFMLLSPWDLGGEDPCYTNFAGQRVARSDAWGSCEVSCCAWAVFKLTQYLMHHTGEAKYGMWAEQMLYNCTGGQPDIKPNGELLYYSSYFADGAMKSTVDRRLRAGGENFVWQCCSGTFPQDVAEYARLAYYHDDNTLYVSQYMPSKVTWERADGAVTVENFSDFPKHSTVRFRVNAPAGSHFALRFRVPAWADGANAVKVNGRAEPWDALPNTWLTVERDWTGDDLVELDFPYRLRFQAVDAQHPNLAALLYGPFVMVSDEMTILVGDREHPEEWILPVEGEELTFRTLPGHTGIRSFVCRTFRPYLSYPEDKWYFMYHTITDSLEKKEKEKRTVNV